MINFFVLVFLSVKQVLQYLIHRVLRINKLIYEDSESNAWSRKTIMQVLVVPSAYHSLGLVYSIRIY